MTRVLLTTAPMASHVRPAVPLVRELIGRGHEVIWYTGGQFESVATAAGARFVAATAPVDEDAILRSVGGRRGFSGLNRLVLELFLKPIPAYAADVNSVFDRLDPEVVVSDHSFRAGLFAAEQRGIPRVAYSTGPLNLSSVDVAPFGLGWQPAASLPGRLRNRVMWRLIYGLVYRERQKVLGRVRAQLGLRPLGGYSIDWVAQITDAYLQTGIPEFEYPRRDLPPSVRFIGPTQPASVDPAARPEWWPELAAAREQGRRVVFVTQGTIATDMANLVLPTVQALAGSDVLLVATTSGQDPETVLPAARRPANLRLEAFVPYTALMPMVDLVVTNGGYGGVQTALQHGVPLVVSGTSEDRMETNARVVWSGTGVSLKTDRPKPARVARAVHKVLGDPSYRDRARDLQRIYAEYAAGSLATDEILKVVAAAGRGEPAPQHADMSPDA